MVRSGHGEGTCGGAADGREEDGDFRLALTDKDGVDGLCGCTKTRRGFGQKELGGGGAAPTNFAGRTEQSGSGAGREGKEKLQAAWDLTARAARGRATAAACVA